MESKTRKQNKEIKLPKKRKEKIKNLDKIKAIDHGFIALPHTPVYKMHRYFARRPWSVFNELIRHYSNPGSIILDPFCGGGVTIVEGLKLKRKVIGVDLNPMATFITRMEVIDVDLNELKKAFSEIEKAVKDEIQKLYLTICPKCKKETPAEWFEWSYIYECPSCKKKVQLSEAKKLKGGKYICNSCKEVFKLVGARRIGETPIRLKINCEYCSFKGEKKPDNYDFKKVKWIERNFKKIVKEKKLWYPKDKIYKGYNTNQLLKQKFYYFHKLFTERNLLSLCLIFKTINEIKNDKIKNLLQLTFTSLIDFSTRLSRVVQGAGREITTHTFWPPTQPAENNIWQALQKRFVAIQKGKLYSKKEVDRYYREAKKFEDLKKERTCLLLTRSSTKLPLLDNLIDVIITDPPYGGNVNYSEMTDLWAIWIRKTLGLKKNEFVDREEEIVINPFQKYLGREKGSAEYRDLMYRVFKECYRVLKPNRWMIMTFHNRNFQVWNAIHLAAHDAGFTLSEEDGMIYQPPIQEYTTTLHQKRGGAMLGVENIKGAVLNSANSTRYLLKEAGLEWGPNVYAVLLNAAEWLVKNGYIAVYDGNQVDKERREAVKELADKLGAKYHLFKIITKEETAEKYLREKYSQAPKNTFEDFWPGTDANDIVQNLKERDKDFYAIDNEDPKPEFFAQIENEGTIEEFKQKVKEIAEKLQQ